MFSSASDYEKRARRWQLRKSAPGLPSRRLFLCSKFNQAMRITKAPFGNKTEMTSSHFFILFLLFPSLYSINSALRAKRAFIRASSHPLFVVRCAARGEPCRAEPSSMPSALHATSLERISHRITSQLVFLRRAETRSRSYQVRALHVVVFFSFCCRAH